ncbi:hypothetical protein MLD38_016038 [Melastoma candidum]|uniref:Uncharacterized protein n=1 Tax=Melastoma candidum TaxID=119954 RepID=A0ACB9RJ98_9MYRT|nr:hypothetical protein MLD38_016038 [Melastoma candidum]
MDGFNSVSSAVREELSNIFLEFLDLVGEANNIRKAHDRHVKLFLHGRANSQGKKHNAEDCLPGNGLQVMVCNKRGHKSLKHQCGQWNPGYPQQPAAYSGYSTSYAPQPAAYNAYPPAYPMQAAPQQSYVQPTAAATAAPLQQAASAPEAYCGTYY